jgi:hypothetical protein
MPYSRRVTDAKMQPRWTDPGNSLVGKLVNTADTVRGLYARFGVAGYRVYMVHARWSGRARGDGTPTVISEVELLPTPMLKVNRNRPVRPGGTIDEGDIQATGVSLTYTEDTLLGKGTGGAPIDSNVDFYWELRTFFQGEDRRIRCSVDKTPTLDLPNCQWVVNLFTQRPNRNREGQMP